MAHVGRVTHNKELTVTTRVMNVVDGKLVGGEPFDVVNPAHFETVVGTAYAATAADVDDAVRAAVAVARAWAGIGLSTRINVLTKAMKRVTALSPADNLAPLLTSEQGKILLESTTEVSHVAAFVQLFSAAAEQALADEVLEDERGKRIKRFAPIGPVAAITPWNWPVALSMIKVVSALLTGNPVLLKPAPNTPLTVSAVLAAMAEELPPGVVSVLNGGAEVGAALTQHPGIRKVSFTGSVPNGRKVYESVAATIKGICLELGGNDAAVLLDDVVLDEDNLGRLLAASFVTSGQVCWAVKRVYAPRSRYREVVDTFAGAIDRFVVGDGLRSEVNMGPVNNATQLGIVSRLREESEAAGATVRELGRYAEGTDPDKGYFHLPTLVSEIENAAPLVQEEQFGPVLPLVSYDDEAQAIAWANGTEFGLCASVWSSDTDRAFEAAGKLDGGQVYVNCHGGPALDFTVGAGGIKQSGLGREMGIEGLREYLELKLITSRVNR